MSVRIIRILNMPVGGSARTGDNLKARVFVAETQTGYAIRASFAGRSHTERLTRTPKMIDAMMAVAEIHETRTRHRP